MDQERSALRELKPPPAAAAGARRAGRDGFLRLGFERRDGATVLVERRFRTPLQILEALSFPDDPAAGVLILNPTGGVLGGDRLVTELCLGAETHVVVSTPSATRVYGSRHEPARLVTTISLGADAVLEYVPDHVIPHPHARLAQRLEIDLAPGARLLLWDAWALGRAARDECWVFHDLDSTVRVRQAGAALFVDRFSLTPARRLAGLGGSEGHAYFAAWLVAGDRTAEWTPLAGELGRLAAEVPGIHAAGSALARGGALVRVLARSAYALAEARRLLWAATRDRVLGRGPLDLRKG